MKEEDKMKIAENTILREDTSERIKKIEEYSRVVFPSSYKDFLSEHNLGIPITKNLSFNGNAYIVERFLGVVNDYKTSPFGSYDIAVVLSQIDTRLSDNPELLGDEVIPIAELFAGDYICLDFRNNHDNPEVCIWFHEDSEEFSPVTTKIADSFDLFLEMLK